MDTVQGVENMLEDLLLRRQPLPDLDYSSLAAWEADQEVMIAKLKVDAEIARLQCQLQ